MLTVHHTRAHAALTDSVASFRSYESLGTNEATGSVGGASYSLVPKLSRVHTCVRGCTCTCSSDGRSGLGEDVGLAYCDGSYAQDDLLRPTAAPLHLH